MTEFALILPVFLLIVVGLLSFGRVLYYWIEANHVASETARWAIVDQNPFRAQTLQEHARAELDQRVHGTSRSASRSRTGQFSASGSSSRFRSRSRSSRS